MSYDYVLFKPRGPMKSAQEFDEQNLLPMGRDADDVQRQISAVFPDVVWDQPYDGAGQTDPRGPAWMMFRVETHQLPPIVTFLDTSFRQNVVDRIRHLCRALGWVAMDMQTNEFLEMPAGVAEA
jgi:hypothetical protein